VVGKESNGIYKENLSDRIYRIDRYKGLVSMRALIIMEVVKMFLAQDGTNPQWHFLIGVVVLGREIAAIKPSIDVLMVLFR
jgi:hypothetical protein